VRTEYFHPPRYCRYEYSFCSSSDDGKCQSLTVAEPTVAEYASAKRAAIPAVEQPAITAGVLVTPAPRARFAVADTAVMVEPEQPNDALGSPLEPFQNAGAASMYRPHDAFEPWS